MPLVECPDCGKKVSDLAPACPGCGRPSQSAAKTGGPLVPGLPDGIVPAPGEQSAPRSELQSRIERLKSQYGGQWRWIKFVVRYRPTGALMRFEKSVSPIGLMMYLRQYSEAHPTLELVNFEDLRPAHRFVDEPGDSSGKAVRCGRCGRDTVPIVSSRTENYLAWEPRRQRDPATYREYEVEQEVERSRRVVVNVCGHCGAEIGGSEWIWILWVLVVLAVIFGFFALVSVK